MAGSVSEYAEKPRLLIIEDDVALSNLVMRFLRSHGFGVDQAFCGAEAQRKSREAPYDLVLCDLMLPDTQGFQLMEKIAQEQAAPFLFLTALSQKEHQLNGFATGAVDYIIKPIDPDVLLARIRAHLRLRTTAIAAPPSPYELPGFRIRAANNQLETGGTLIPLSHHETRLLCLMVKHRNTILSRDFLFDHAVERQYDGLDRTIDGRVSRLRKKLDAIPECPYEIRTAWGRGYVFGERG